MASRAERQEDVLVDTTRRYRLLALVEGEPIERVDKEPEDTVMVWPNLILIELLAALAIGFFLFIFSILRNAPLEALANPDLTTNPAKAPWYFMNLQELLLHMHPALAGVIVPTVLILVLMAIPYIDNRREGVGIWFASRKGRTIALFSALYSAVLVIGLILFDSFAAGRRPGGAVKALTGWPEAITDWVIPILVIVGLLILLVFIVRWRWAASVREVLIALFTAFVVSYLVLTLCGFLFRGPGMELFWPWAMPEGYNPLDSF